MATVLLVDDDDLVRYALGKLLSKAGHTIIEEPNGMKVPNIVESQDPDILVTDIIMPDREGLETIMMVRQLRPTLPIIAMSGGGRVVDTDILSSAEELGADAVLQKPFDEQLLIDLVAKLVASAK